MTSGKHFNKGVKAPDAQILVMSQGKLLTKSWSLEEEMKNIIYDICSSQKFSKLVRMLIDLKNV